MVRHATQQLEPPVDDRVARELALGAVAAGATERLEAVPVLCELPERLREGGRILGGNDYARLAFPHELGGFSARRQDDWDAGGHRLDQLGRQRVSEDRAV